MYLYVELWRFRPAWLELSQGDRKAWMDKLLAGLQQQLQSGVELVGFASNDGDTPHSSGYDFLAVWKMPNNEVSRVAIWWKLVLLGAPCPLGPASPLIL